MMLRTGVAFALLSSLSSAFEWKNLRRQGHVSDFAGVVDAASKRQLEEYCESFARAGGMRIDLVTIPTLQGEPVQDVARTLASAWGNSGVIVLLAIREHASRIEVAPWASRLVTDRMRAQTIWVMGPALREQRYGEALREAAETLGVAISRATGISPPRGFGSQERRSSASRLPWAVAAIVAGVAVSLILFWRIAERRRERAFRGRNTWGSRGSGGFGGFDSADSFGGFGGDTGRPSGSGDW